MFGAGPGACQYIENNTPIREFIGFLDNDTQKHGHIYEGLPIYSPDKIHSLDFEEVVITTQWAIEVQKQLLEKLKVAPTKVILPNKNQLKKVTPFLHSGSISLARNIVKTLNELAVNNKTPLVVDFGTLLGIVRDADIIEWDDDVDLAVPEEYATETESLLKIFVQLNLDGLNWRLEKVADKQNNLVGFLLKFSDPKSDLVPFTTSICLRKCLDGNSLHMPSLGMWFAPQKHFDKVQQIEWHGQSIQVPSEYEEYLTFQYGDWKVPKKDIQLSDYANLNEISFDDVKKASMTSTLVSGNE